MSETAHSAARDHVLNMVSFRVVDGARQCRGAFPRGGAQA